LLFISSWMYNSQKRFIYFIVYSFLAYSSYFYFIYSRFFILSWVSFSCLIAASLWVLIVWKFWVCEKIFFYAIFYVWTIGTLYVTKSILI
jgi:hypothetical protein